MCWQSDSLPKTQAWEPERRFPDQVPDVEAGGCQSPAPDPMH